MAAVCKMYTRNLVYILYLKIGGLNYADFEFFLNTLINYLEIDTR